MNNLEIKDVKDVHLAIAKISTHVIRAIKDRDPSYAFSILLLGGNVLDALDGISNYFPQIEDMSAEELAEVDAAVKMEISLADKELEQDIENINAALLSILRIVSKSQSNVSDTE